MELHLKIAADRVAVRFARGEDGRVLTREDGTTLPFEVVHVAPEFLLLDLDGIRHRVHYWREQNVMHLQARGRTLRVALEDPDEVAVAGGTDQNPVLRAPMPGRILEVLTAVGETVQAGQALVRMEAMKMEIDVTAPIAGTVGAVEVKAGDLVDPDAALIRIDALPEATPDAAQPDAGADPGRD